MRDKVKKSLYAISAIAAGFGLLDVFFPLPLEKELSFVVLAKDATLLSVLLTKDEKWRLPVEITDVNKTFIDYLIAFEDKRFYWHPGVDPFALFRALVSAIAHGKIISGGSTLTMQVVKLLEPRPRTMLSKCIEIMRALQLELHLTKKEILTLYLKLAPYGSNLEGIRAASLAYFQKEPFHLTPSEAAFLVALPQHPGWASHPNKRRLLKAQRDKILRSLHPKFFDATALRLFCQDPIPEERRPFPSLAYHLAHRLRYTCKHNPCTTTLNKTIQEGLEKLLKSEDEKHSSDHLFAALVVENTTKHILGYIGSSDPLNKKKQGCVDMVPAIRSPGSTLKPFIFGYAFEEGLLTPESRLLDTPYDFKGYAPTNFREHFRGQVTARETLQLSLNVPTVRVMEQVRPSVFMHWLASFGVRLHLPQNRLDPSLAIALGGVGVSFWDLTALYTALASQGTFQNLTYSLSSVPTEKLQLFSPTITSQLCNILQSASPPPGYAPRSIEALSPIAFKTGTSYGHRDAWCFGYTSCHTVGVWSGRADGTAVADQMGRLTASPLVFKIFSLIEPALSSPSNFAVQPPAFIHHTRSAETLPRQPFEVIRPAAESKILIDNQTFPFTAQGGKGPYYWILNGQLIGKTKLPKLLWKLPSPGFYTLTIIDDEGVSTSCYFKGVEVQTTHSSSSRIAK